MNAARTQLRMTAAPASSMAAAVPSRRPVPIEPPTATMVICPALSWWRRPVSDCGLGEDMGMVGCTRSCGKVPTKTESYSGVASRRVTALGTDGRFGGHPVLVALRLGTRGAVRVGQFRAGDYDPVAAFVFCPIKCFVGEFEQQINLAGSFLEPSDSD